MTSKIWHPNSWQSKSCLQNITYADPKALLHVMSILEKLPPLVTPVEIKNLKKQLADATLNKGFVLQAGDCAESFSDCHSDSITSKLKILLQMSLILLHGLRKPIIRIGRIAGQYAKPRSADTETQDNITLPCYRGDVINKPEFTLEARTPNPDLMLQGYQYSALTLNYLRALIDSGFASLEHPENWNLDFVQHSPLANEYQAFTRSLGDTLDFINTVEGLRTSSINRVDFFTSHESLHLLYEQALTRQTDPNHWYNLSAHFLWVGMRTADVNSAHIEYLRGISNPIGVKVGPKATPEWLIELIDILNPNNEPGRLTFITRMGATQIEKCLPSLIEAVQAHGKHVLWLCDPMHGNTQVTEQNIKTRHFSDILCELEKTFQIHHQLNSHLGGVHLELTGENVTECLGGARGLAEKDLTRAYKSLVDPRLNYEQSLEIAMLIVRQIGAAAPHKSNPKD
ncbi:MAG: 3-deoxy-7-phosphoheptulonate synthase [Proteobacteria bacterium]|nr:3-deoxy-7-phosphoheptulonate synthase [Pseudomonadota bacterium]